VNTKNCKPYVVGLTVSVWAFTALGLPVLAQSKAKAKSAEPTQAEGKSQTKGQPTAKGATSKPTTTGMAGPGKLVPAELRILGRGCTVLVPGDYRLSEFVEPGCKLFCFRGPEHPDKQTAVFNVSIATTPTGAAIPSEREMMETMLNPHRSSLANYKEQKEPLFTNGGHAFKGMSFSGTVKENQVSKDSKDSKAGKDSKDSKDSKASKTPKVAVNRRGFVYLSQDKDTFFILFGLDEEPYAEKSMPILLKTAASCSIQMLLPDTTSAGKAAENASTGKGPAKP
jgi:hypothetical protein